MNVHTQNLGEGFHEIQLNRETETKIFAHDSQTWLVMAKKKKKKLQNHQRISHISLNLPALYSQSMTRISLTIFEALPELDMMST